MSPASARSSRLGWWTATACRRALTLHLQDEAVSFTVKAAAGRRDQGAQDPGRAICHRHAPRSTAISTGGERVDQLLIRHDPRYLLLPRVALTTTADDEWFIVPPAW